MRSRGQRLAAAAVLLSLGQGSIRTWTLVTSERVKYLADLVETCHDCCCAVLDRRRNLVQCEQRQQQLKGIWVPGDCSDKPVLRPKSCPELGRGFLPDGVEQLAV